MNIEKRLTELIEGLNPKSVYSNLRFNDGEDYHYVVRGEDAANSTRSYHIIYYADKREYLSFPPKFKTTEFDEVLSQLTLWALGEK